MQRPNRGQWREQGVEESWIKRWMWFLGICHFLFIFPFQFIFPLLKIECMLLLIFHRIASEENCFHCLCSSQNKPENAWYHSPPIHTGLALLHPQDVFCIIGLYQLLCQIWTRAAQTPDQANSDCGSMHRTVPGSLGFGGDMNYKQLMHIKLTMCMLGHTHGQGEKAREISGGRERDGINNLSFPFAVLHH